MDWTGKSLSEVRNPPGCLAQSASRSAEHADRMLNLNPRPCSSKAPDLCGINGIGQNTGSCTG